MANVIIYDKDTGLVKDYRESVNTPDYPDALKVETRPTTELKYLKVVDEKLVEFTQKEKDAVTASELAVKEAVEKEFTDKIDAIKDVEGVKSYLKTRGQWL